MFALDSYLLGLAVIAAAALLTWVGSLIKRDASIVDALWGPFFLFAPLSYWFSADTTGARSLWMLVLVGVWALRLSAHIVRRNWGQPEDRRYRAMRRRHSPNFPLKSLYLVFGLQAVLAWIISLPLLAAVDSDGGPGPIAFAGIGLWLLGMYFETVGDLQLARFKADPRNAGKVMDRGLWAYTRHPNYFGECCIWWAYYLIALDAGAWWAIVSPLLMTLLLLKVSGVSLLEQDISERRPGYAQYVRRTNAFIPGPRREPVQASRKMLLAGLLAQILGPAQDAGSASSGATPDVREWRFDVLLDDARIGYHRFKVTEWTDDGLVESVAEFSVRILFFNAYRYEHHNIEQWDDGCLERIVSRTNDNGSRYAVEGSQQADRFLVSTAAGGESALPPCVMSFAYWNPSFLQQERLLNPQTGAYVPVDVAAPVEEIIELNGAPTQALRYRITGPDLRIDVWYSKSRQWLALESSVDDGRRLRYLPAYFDSEPR